MHSLRPLNGVKLRQTKWVTSPYWMAGLVLSISAIGCGGFEGSEEFDITESAAIGVGQCIGAAAQNVPNMPVYTPGNLPANTYFAGANQQHFCTGHTGPAFSNGARAEVWAPVNDVQESRRAWLGEGEIIMGYVIENGQHKPVLNDAYPHPQNYTISGGGWFVRESGHYMALCSFRNAECLLACNGTRTVCRLGDKKSEAEIRNDCFGEFSAPLDIGSGQCDAAQQTFSVDYTNVTEWVYNGDPMCNDSCNSAPTCEATSTITNVALNKSTSQSSTGHGGASSRAVDGNTNGRYHSGSVTHTNNQAGAWWRVNLGSAHSIDRVVVWNRTDCCSNRLSNFHVEYLDQNNNVIQSQHFSGSPNPNVTMAVTASNVHAVRVRLAGTNYLSLAEVQVFGYAPTNVALNKPTSQSSNAAGGASSRAVDGNTDGRWSQSSVTHTGYQTGAWWRVDLEGAHSVDQVVIWNRTDCCSNRLSNFHVEYLDQNNNVIQSQHFSGSPNPSVTMAVAASNVHAVRVRLAGQNYLSLAEVQVFGSCSP